MSRKKKIPIETEEEILEPEDSESSDSAEPEETLVAEIVEEEEEGPSEVEQLQQEVKDLRDAMLRMRAETENIRKRLQKAEVEAIAIGLLHSYAHPEDEEEIATALESLGASLRSQSRTTWRNFSGSSANGMWPLWENRTSSEPSMSRCNRADALSYGVIQSFEPDAISVGAAISCIRSAMS